MKLLILLFLCTFCVKNVFNKSVQNECCPENKLEWCKSDCYTCTPEDEYLLKEEQKLFDKFMKSVAEYDKLKTTRYTIECKSKDDIVPVQVSITENKTNTKYKLYQNYYLNFTQCNNCGNYSTPTLYANCVIPIRIKMNNDIVGISEYIKKYLKDHVGKHRSKCSKIKP